MRVDISAEVFNENNGKTICCCDVWLVEVDGNFTLVVNGHVLESIDSDGLALIKKACEAGIALQREPKEERYFREVAKDKDLSESNP